jgi:hypothetical protein
MNASVVDLRYRMKDILKPWTVMKRSLSCTTVKKKES